MSVDDTICFAMTYLLDDDLSFGKRYPPSIQLGPDWYVSLRKPKTGRGMMNFGAYAYHSIYRKKKRGILASFNSISNLAIFYLSHTQRSIMYLLVNNSAGAKS